MIGAKGGGGGSSFVTKPDNLRSNDSFEILLGLGSGRWKGLTNGLQSFKINGVPLENEDGTSNFENVFLIFADGNPLEDQIVTFKLGGGGNSQTVNTTLANSNPSGPGGWVSGAVSTPGANFIDLRFIAQQLFYQDTKGIRENTATIDIEMRPSGSSTWINIFAAPTSNTITYNPDGYDYYENYGNYNSRIYLSQSMFNPGGVGFKAGNGQGMAITGKTSSAFVKEIRISVPNAGAYANKTWEVRARLKEKDSVDSGDIQERRSIVFESITAVINEPLGDDPEWDGLVWAQIYGKASDQFNGFPEVTSICDTKICKVPPGTVFNPETRAYTITTWDGSYVEAFTTDPAWQIKEFVEDPIHGLAGLNPGATLDKWDALEASKYFSQLVPDGKGGTHPRFSMNYTINEAKEVEEQMQFLAGAVNSYTEDIGNGVWRFKVDKPETPIMLFTEDNIFGEFTYSHSPIDTRFNDWRGTFLDETLDYETNTVRVFDQADIDANGTKFTEVALIGCTHPQEALRRLMFRLRVSLNEYKMVSFTTNRVGRLISPLSTILVADGALNPDHLVKSTSRLHSHSGTTVTLKRAVRLQSGVAYKMKFTLTDGQVIERNVTNSTGLPGDFTNITINSALPGNVMPESAVALSATGLAALPVAYRVVGIERSEDNEDEYNVSAVFIDVGKWDAMDNVDADVIAAQESVITIGPPTEPVDGIFNVVEYTTDFQKKRVLQVNWNRPSSMYLDGFRFEWRLNDGQWRIGSELLKDSIFELQNPEDGKYEIKVTALDRRGVQSNPLVATYVFDGDAIVTPPAHTRGPASAFPTGVYDGFRYTVTDGAVPVVYVYDADTSTWVPETNLITEGSQIGVENGATVGMTPSEEAILDAALGDIDDLIATYGSTASAAASAALAAAAEALASAAAVAAEDEKDAALAAATAAGGFATTASTHADAASGSMSAAAGSAVTAGGHASAASSSAAAASTSASSASTQAGLSATYSGQARLSAASLIPGTFAAGGTHFFAGYDGDPATRTPLTLSGVGSFPDVAGIGKVAQLDLGGTYDLSNIGVIQVRAGRTYRVTTRYRTLTSTRGVVMYMITLDANYAYIPIGGLSVSPTATTTWQTSSLTVTGDSLLAEGAAYIRCLARVGAGGASLQWSIVHIEDVTESVTAANQASISTAQAVLSTAAASTATTQSSLSAAYANTNGIVPNGNFTSGPQLWDAGSAQMTWAAVGYLDNGLWQHNGGAQTSLYGPHITIDPTRRWRAVITLTQHNGNLSHYGGLACYNSAGASLGNIYFDNMSGQTHNAGSRYEREQIYSGVNPAFTSPVYTNGGKFPPTTATVRPLILSNYTNIAGGLTDWNSFFMEDVTESYTATTQAGISTSQAATATAAASTATTQATLSATHSAAAKQSAASTYPSGFTDPTQWTSNTTWGGTATFLDGRCYTTNSAAVLATWRMVIDPAKTYRIRGRYKLNTYAAGSDRAYLGAYGYNASGVAVGIVNWDLGDILYPGPAGTVVTLSADVLGSVWIARGYTSVSPNLLVGYSASGATGEVLELGIQDVTSEVTATSQANVAISQTATATAAAAAAQTSAIISASIGRGYINPNANFAHWPTDTSNPVVTGVGGWDVWQGGAISPSGSNRRLGMASMGLSLRGPEGSEWVYQGVAATSTTEAGLITNPSLIPISAGRHTVEATAQLMDGNYAGAGVLVYMFDGAGSYQGAHYLRFWTDADINGVVSTGGFGIRKWSSTFTTFSNTAFIRLYAMTNWLGFPTAASAAKVIAFYKVGVKAGDATDATVATHASAIATLNGSVATWETIVAAGGGFPAMVRLKAGVGGSAIDLAASRLVIYNPSNTGQQIEVARFEGGVARLNDALIRNLQVAPRSDANIYFQVELRPKIYVGTDGQTIVYEAGKTLGAAPERIVPDVSGIPLAAGEVLDVKAVSVSATQFTVRAKKNIPGAATVQNSGAGTAVGGTPFIQVHKPTAADAHNGYYTFQFDMTLPLISEEPDFGGMVFANYAGTVQIYVNSGSGFVLISSNPYYRSEYMAGPAPGAMTYNNETVTINYTSAIGQHGGYEFGIHPAGGAYGLNLDNVSYSTHSVSSEVALTNAIPFLVYPSRG